MYQAIALQVFDVAHHSEIHNKNLPAQPGQDYCNSYEWYHLIPGFVKAHPKTFLTQYFDEHLGCAKLALECFLSTIPCPKSFRVPKFSVTEINSFNIPCSNVYEFWIFISRKGIVPVLPIISIFFIVISTGKISFS